MSEFKREARYVVVKISDMIDAGLTSEQVASFNSVCDQVARTRAANGKSPLACVVVEKDWREYEPTWLAIAQRVGVEAGKSPLKARCDYYESGEGKTE